MTVKEKLARGEMVTMILVNYPSPALVEDLGRLGFDIAMVDCEKGAATPERIEEMCRAGRAAGIAVAVRPWMNEPGLVSRYLDLGADGIMVAAVDEARVARDLVEAVRYARFKDFDKKLIIPMIESPRAIDVLPELLAVDGIDAWFIGPNDLAHRMGYPGNADRAEVRDAVRRTLGAIKAAGRVAGTLATIETARELKAAGARLLLTRVRDLLGRGAHEFRHGMEESGGTG